jgi:hypothetical protein
LIEIISQILEEVEDLRAAIECEEEYMSESNPIVEPAAKGLLSLLITLENEEYQLDQGGWLAFLNSARDDNHRSMPF